MIEATYIIEQQVEEFNVDIQSFKNNIEYMLCQIQNAPVPTIDMDEIDDIIQLYQSRYNELEHYVDIMDLDIDIHTGYQVLDYILSVQENMNRYY
jgi:hypothetical protein